MIIRSTISRKLSIKYWGQKVDISGHAVDRASLRLDKRWHDLSHKQEGLYSWLVRMSVQALNKGTTIACNKIAYKQILFVFDSKSSDILVLKTVMLNSKKVR